MNHIIFFSYRLFREGEGSGGGFVTKPVIKENEPDDSLESLVEGEVGDALDARFGNGELEPSEEEKKKMIADFDKKVELRDSDPRFKKSEQQWS